MLNLSRLPNALLIAMANAISVQLDEGEELNSEFDAIIKELERRDVVTSDYVVYPHEQAN